MTSLPVLLQGKNVSITLEMAERIAERIDANLLDCNVQDIKDIPARSLSLDPEVVLKTTGKFFIKEYPTVCNTGHFDALLKELASRRVPPDIIFIDYLNIALLHAIRLAQVLIKTRSSSLSQNCVACR